MPRRGRPLGTSSKSASCSSSSSGVGFGLGDSDRELGRVSIHREHEPRVLAIELHRGLAGLDHGLVRVEAVEHPADRRGAIGSPPRVDRARDDQAVDRARHRDVVEAEPLRAFLVALGVADLLEAEDRLPVAARRVHHAEAEATVRERDDLVRAARPARVAPRVGDHDDLELEALRGVDRQQPNRSAALLLGDGLELPRAERVLVADEADESLDVGAPHRLVVARESPELADVREAASAVPAREHGQVVVVLRDDALAELLEPDPGSRAHEAFVALEEGPKQALVALVELLRERPLERREQRTARSVPPDEHQRVVRDADERRCEHRRERDVVVPVVEQPQVGEEVDDLLLAEVAAAGRAVRREPFAPERLFVALGVGARGEEDDDLSGLRLARVHELANTCRRYAAPRPCASARSCRRSSTCR